MGMWPLCGGPFMSSHRALWEPSLSRRQDTLPQPEAHWPRPGSCPYSPSLGPCRAVLGGASGNRDCKSWGPESFRRPHLCFSKLDAWSLYRSLPLHTPTITSEPCPDIQPQKKGEEVGQAGTRWRVRGMMGKWRAEGPAPTLLKLRLSTVMLCGPFSGRAVQSGAEWAGTR